MGTTNFDAVAAPDGFTGPIDGAVGNTTPATGTFTYIRESAATTLTAAGKDRATSLALTSAINNITTAASGTGVTLPAVSTFGIGGTVRVYNNGANAIQVYGAGSDTIDGKAAATGVTLTNSKAADFTAVAAATILSDTLGAASS